MNKKITAFILTLSMILPVAALADDSLTELAANQYAEASSEMSAQAAADKANDGINDNADYTAWRSADTDLRPYWQTDLAVAYKISKIEIEARKDGAAEERSAFRVLVSNDPDFTEFEIAGECKEDFGANGVFSIDVKVKDRYQYVRVEKTADGALSIGEIKIYAKTSTIFYGSQSPASNSQQPETDEATRFEIPKDMIGTDIEDEVYFLSSLNIMRGYPDGSFLPDGYITRAEFAAVAARILNYTMHSSGSTFADVPSSHWAYDAVEICYEAGLIDGVEEGVFAPEEQVTFDQAVKIIVSALGYGQMAQANGGYPGGYRDMALTLGILDGVANDNGQITRGNIAKMCYNALFARLLDVYDKDADETLLSKSFKLSKTKGLVTEVTGMNLTDSTVLTTDGDHIVVNGIQMSTDNPYYRDWFGYTVEVYYREDGNGGYETAVVIPSKKSDTLEFDAEDVRFDDSYTLYYRVDSKEKHIKFRNDLDVVFNGKAKLVYDNATLIPNYGSIKAIDNDDDGIYDIMIIKAIKTGVVNFVNEQDNIIYLKFSSDADKTIKYTDNDAVNIYNIEGEKLELKDLKEWNVLSVEMSDNATGEKAIDICVSDVFARGEITAVGKETVTIRNKQYPVANSLNIASLKPGDKGIFYLDCYGSIAAFDGDKRADGKYGFLTKAYGDESGEDIYIHIFTASGAVEKFKASEKLKIDGAACTTEADILTKLAASNWGSGMADPVWNNVSQLVKYSSNSKAEIWNIDTIASGVGETAENLSRDFDNESRSYISRTGAFGMKLMLSDDVFFVRCSDDWSEEGYEIVAKSSLESGIGHTFEAYDADDVNIAKAAVIMPGLGSTPSYGASFAVVDEIYEGINADGDTVQIMQCWHKGKLVEYKEDKPNVMSALSLEKGDIVAFSLSSDNEIKSIQKRFYDETMGSTPSGSISHSKPIGPNNQDPSWNSCYYYGNVYSRKGNIARVKINDLGYTYQNNQGNYKELLMNLSAIKYMYLYDSANDLVRLATPADFLDELTTSTGVNVVCHLGSSEVREAVILK